MKPCQKQPGKNQKKTTVGANTLKSQGINFAQRLDDSLIASTVLLSVSSVVLLILLLLKTVILQLVHPVVFSVAIELSTALQTCLLSSTVVLLTGVAITLLKGFVKREAWILGLLRPAKIKLMWSGLCYMIEMEKRGQTMESHSLNIDLDKFAEF